MAVDGIGGYSYAAYGNVSKKTQSDPAQAATSTDDAATNFLAEAHKSPAQRIREQWLKAHKLSEKDLEQKSPEERKAIEDSIAQDIKRSLANKDDQRGSLVDFAA